MGRLRNQLLPVRSATVPVRIPLKEGGCALAAAVGLFVLTGCVERTITITSEPAGALVYLNDREVGRTPVDVEFVHYGTYDVRLVKDGYEPLLTSGKANAPIWDLPGPDLLAELAPVELRSDIEWHFMLEPADSDPEALIERAQQFRQRIAPPESQQDAQPAPGTTEDAEPGS